MPFTPSIKARSALRWVLYYLCTGIFVAGPAFVNQYPLVYSDSGAYLENSYTLWPNDDRPIGYGLIIRAVTMESTLWTLVLFQGMVVSWLLMLTVRELVADRGRWKQVHLLLLAVLLMGSSLPWYAAQVMADIYTPLVLLIAFLLFRGERLGRWREGALWVLLFFFLATHNAHFPMALALSGLLLLRAWRTTRFRAGRGYWWRWAGFNAAIAGAMLMVMLFNWSAHGRLQFSRAGNVFLAGRLCQAGIMQDYLERNCPRADCALCPYVGHLPMDAGDLLWSPDQFVKKEGLSIAQADSALAPVVSDVLGQGAYLVRFARSALVSTAVQVFQYQPGQGLIRYGPESSPYPRVVDKFPDERYSYRSALQQRGAWGSMEALDHIVAAVLLLSVLVLALLAVAPRPHPRTAQLARWALAWIVLNAAVTSSLSVLDSRLQARVMWLLPLVAALVVLETPSLRRLFRWRPDPAGT